MELKAAVIDTPAPVAAPKTTKKFLGNIHYFRGVAIIFVVAAHVMVNWEPDSVMSKILGVIASNATILFLFIAGYLFQHLSKNYEYGDYLRKKFQNVICPYLIISAPVIAFRVIYQHVPVFTLEEHPDFASWPKWEQAFFYLAHGAHLQQLWFIPMIAIYYVISPVFIYIDRHPRLYLVLIPLFIISLVVPRARLSETFSMAIHFLSVYLFSMFMSRYKDKALEIAKKYWVPITVVPLGLIVVNYFSPAWIYDQVSFVQRVLASYMFLYWLWRLEKFMPSFLHTLAELSFGIYFVHFFFVMLVRGVYLKIFQHEVPGTLLHWTISFIIALMLSVWFLQLVKKIFGKKSKYLVGC